MKNDNSNKKILKSNDIDNKFLVENSEKSSVHIGPSSKYFRDLFSKVYGVPYDFRFKTVGDKVALDVKNILKSESLNAKVYSCFQTHSKNVRIIGKDEDKPFVYGRIFMDSDGTPIVFYDSNMKILGSCHSGWRGTVGGVSKSTIEAMESLGSSIKNIHAYIGPSIGQENYEVGLDVYDEFLKISDEVPHILTAFNKSKTKEDKYYLNMKLANYIILKSLGIKEENIEVSPEFTFGNPRIHSAREEGEGYGLNAILTMIK